MNKIYEMNLLREKRGHKFSLGLVFFLILFPLGYSVVRIVGNNLDENLHQQQQIRLSQKSKDKPVKPAVAVSRPENLLANKALKGANTTPALSIADSNLPIPQGMRVDGSNNYHHTAVVGSSTHPTFDGGIINAADGIPVVEPAPKANVLQNETAVAGTTANTGDFNDSWANSKGLTAVLNEAAQSGKLNLVLAQAKADGLPSSVALLPVLESRYQDSAVSPKGAVGAWQMTPQTALGYGLNPLNRTSFAPETDAALTLLQDLHTQFGNWNLAFAAYNAGSGRVEKALSENPKATSINELNLPSETKAYVARLKAMSQKLGEIQIPYRIPPTDNT